ncbi:hypothetical protein ACFX2C_033894 [Malus domestica]
MAIANLQAQMAILTSQLSQYIERTTIQSTPTFDVSYTQGYQADQHPQRSWESYHDHNQSMNNLFSNTYSSDWRDHSNTMWWEPQPVQHEGYWQPYEEFYTTPMQPPQPAPQQFQSNSGSSIDCAQILDVLTSLTHDQQNQEKELEELKSQMGEIMEFMVQIQEQGDLKDEAVPEPSKHSPNMDELLLQAEEEEDDLGSLEEFLLQAPQIPMSSNSCEEVLNSLHSNIIPPNVLCPCRFLIPNIKESEKDIVEALPKVQSDISILGAPKQVPDGFETFKEPCTPRKGIQENEVVEAYQEYIQEAVHETIKPKAVEFDDTGQATTIIVNLAKSNIPETFKNVVFVIEFLSDKASKPSSPISILVYTNLLILMIQAPTLEFKPLPDHVKYHRPFKDQFHAMGPIQV